MKKGYIYILVTAALFSSMEITLKMTAGQFDPIQITFLRFLMGGLVLLPIALRGLKKRDYRLKIGDITFFALTGFICVVVSMVFYQLAILYAKASVVAVLFSCNPIFVVFFAWILLHEKITIPTVLSVTLSVLGILLIIDPFHFSGSPLGITLVLLSALTFGLYGVIGRTRSARYGVFALTGFSFLFGCLEMLVLMWISRIGVVSDFLIRSGFAAFADIPVLHGLSLQSLPVLLYLGVVATGFGYACYFLAMEATSAATASLVFFIKPILAPLLALLILHEPITAGMAAGIAIILAGSLISLVPAFRRRG